MTATLIRDETDERAAWLLWRRGGVGGSDVPAILGVSRHGSPFTVWADKVGLLPLDEDPDDVMKFGKYAELMVAPWFEAETGLHVHATQECCTHPAHSHHLVTLDGKVSRTPSGPTVGGLEIKTESFGRRSDITLPPDFEAQGQWQMHVAGLDRVYFAILQGHRLNCDHVLERDDQDIALMVERVDEFWERYVLAGEPPPIDGSDATAAALAALYPTATPGKSVPVDHLAGTLVEWAAAKAEKKAAEEAVQTAANTIRAALRDAETGTISDEGTVDGYRVVSWREETRTVGVDEDRLRAERPILGLAYTLAKTLYPSTTTHRVLRAHKPPKNRRTR